MLSVPLGLLTSCGTLLGHLTFFDLHKFLASICISNIKAIITNGPKGFNLLKG